MKIRCFISMSTNFRNRIKNKSNYLLSFSFNCLKFVINFIIQLRYFNQILFIFY